MCLVATFYKRESESDLDVFVTFSVTHFSSLHNFTIMKEEI